MPVSILILPLLLCCVLVACKDERGNATASRSAETHTAAAAAAKRHSDTDTTVTKPTKPPKPSVADNQARTKVIPRRQYNTLFRRILAGAASLAETRLALTDPDVSALTNTTHALHSMAWDRGVLYLIRDMWALKKNKYPELNWDEIEKPPVRIALANVINRLQKADGLTEHIDYIRRFKADEAPFNQAQVLISLGFNGSLADLDYLLSHVAPDKDAYLTQNAVTALGLMDNAQAKAALIELEQQYTDEKLGFVIRDILKQAYEWEPAPAS